MTPEEFELRVYELAQERDPEYFHGETDELMENILIDLGYSKGIEIIRSKTRWYA